MANSFQRKALNLATQQLMLRKFFPEARCRIKNSHLIWVGQLVPSPLSRSYSVRLCYKLRGNPSVEVLEPRLKKRKGKKPPHLYSGERLCLYMPRVGDWDRSMLLSGTIIPWASEWLLHYEIWLATGEWFGGGVHPKVGS